MKGIAAAEDSTPIAYEAQGKVEPALVFIRGWCWSRSYWDAQIARFSHQHRVVVLDLAGHGESGLVMVYAMISSGGDVSAVVKALGQREVVLIGHSMGAAVIVEAALRLGGRVAGIVGVDTSRHLRPDLIRGQMDETRRAMTADFPNVTRHAVRESMFPSHSDQTLRERVASDMALVPAWVGISAARTPSAGGASGLRAPKVAINSGARSFDEGEAERHGIRVLTMPAGGHLPILEEPEPFNEMLKEAAHMCLSMPLTP